MGSKGTPFDSPAHGRHGLRGTFSSPAISFRKKPDFLTLYLTVYKLGPFVVPYLKLCSPSSCPKIVSTSPDTIHFAFPRNPSYSRALRCPLSDLSAIPSRPFISHLSLQRPSRRSPQLSQIFLRPQIHSPFLICSSFPPTTNVALLRLASNNCGSHGASGTHNYIFTCPF